MKKYSIKKLERKELEIHEKVKFLRNIRIQSGCRGKLLNFGVARWMQLAMDSFRSPNRKNRY